MRSVIGLALFSFVVHAGVIQGEVLEYASGRPLSRTVVLLEPIPGQAGDVVRPLQLRASASGHFVFPTVASGLYLLKVRREGFSPAAYGQRRPTGQGTPIQVTPDSDLFAEFRMRRMGAISGRVLDENGVGLSGIAVLAYRARLPLRSVASAKSDDRGVYRIAGLDPGKYWVRTAAAILDDGSGLLPTFGPLARETRDARVQTVNLDEEAQDANVQPEPGSLFHLSGKVQCDRMEFVNITLSSETGRRSTRAMCGGQYGFEGLSPAAYEIFAAYDDQGGFGFMELALDHDTDAAAIQVMKAPTADFEFRNASDLSALNTSLAIAGRRDDLSGVEMPVKIPTPHTTLAPGHWEMNALTGPNQFVQSITPRATPRSWRPERPPDWSDVFVGQRYGARIQVLVSNQAGHISGSVTAGGASIPGAPIFLLPLSESSMRSLGGIRQFLADANGHFDVGGLPPGDYRVLATFDYAEADADVFQQAQAITINVAASQTKALDVTLWLAP